MLGEDLLVVSSQFHDLGLFMHNRTKLLLLLPSSSSSGGDVSGAFVGGCLRWRLLLSRALFSLVKLNGELLLRKELVTADDIS